VAVNNKSSVSCSRRGAGASFSGALARRHHTSGRFADVGTQNMKRTVDPLFTVSMPSRHHLLSIGCSPRFSSKYTFRLSASAQTVLDAVTSPLRVRFVRKRSMLEATTVSGPERIYGPRRLVILATWRCPYTVVSAPPDDAKRSTGKRTGKRARTRRNDRQSAFSLKRAPFIQKQRPQRLNAKRPYRRAKPACGRASAGEQRAQRGPIRVGEPTR